MRGGKLRDRVAFFSKAETPTSYGIAAGDWVFQFMRSANVRIQHRHPNGTQLARIAIRWSESTTLIEPSWMARDVRNGMEFQIRSVVPDSRRQFIKLICEIGVAV